MKRLTSSQTAFMNIQHTSSAGQPERNGKHRQISQQLHHLEIFTETSGAVITEFCFNYTLINPDNETGHKRFHEQCTGF